MACVAHTCAMLIDSCYDSDFPSCGLVHTSCAATAAGSRTCECHTRLPRHTCLSVFIKFQVHASSIPGGCHRSAAPATAQGDGHHPIDVTEGDGHADAYSQGSQEGGNDDGKGNCTSYCQVTLTCRVLGLVVLIVDL